MSDIYYKICVNCSYNLDPSEWQCPRCGGRKFRMEFREPMTIGGAPGSVEFPVFYNKPSQTKIITTGDITVDFASVRKVYTFSKIKKRKENLTHFIEIRSKETRKDGNYLDIIFGVKGGNHSHIGYKVYPRTLFHENRIRSNTIGEFFFDKDDGGFIPLQKIIKDVDKNLDVYMKFALNCDTGKIDLVSIEFM